MPVVVSTHKRRSCDAVALNLERGVAPEEEQWSMWPNRADPIRGFAAPYQFPEYVRYLLVAARPSALGGVGSVTAAPADDERPGNADLPADRRADGRPDADHRRRYPRRQCGLGALPYDEVKAIMQREGQRDATRKREINGALKWLRPRCRAA
jgi:hypothetical protein